MRSAVCRVLPFLCVFWLQSSAWADELRVVETSPTDHQVIQGQLNSFYVRFDRPVDHIWSRLKIERDGKVIETLHPRFEAEPEVLYAASPTLAPGAYRLRWSVRSLEKTDLEDGSISFTIAPKQ
ncbi:copper resistance CopC family protein [Enhydrobacter aerosaccus]|uniref:copper resistance CopC family protein n=1 Tax=Enhydrobacter aerosaccus TaxID=225324 RepID=UPI0014830DEC|nr:copper resistance protein CopC [Enhydrobacter aerosaccus]